MILIIKQNEIIYSKVVKFGAVEIGLYASDISFMNYKGSVYQNCTNTVNEHEVTLVG